MGPSVWEHSRPGPDVRGSTSASGPLRLPRASGGNHRPTANAANAKSPNQPWLSGNQLELFPGPVRVAADCRRHDSSSLTRTGKLPGASRKLQRSQDLPVSPTTLDSLDSLESRPPRPPRPAHVSPSLCATEQHRTTAPGSLIFRLSPASTRRRPPVPSVFDQLAVEKHPTARVLPTRHGRRVEATVRHPPFEIAPCVFAHCSPAIAPSSKWLHTPQNDSRPPSSAK